MCVCKWVFVRGRWPHSSYEARSDYDIQKTLKDPARSIALSPSPFVRTCSLKSPNRSSFSHMRQHSDSPIAWRVCCSGNATSASFIAAASVECRNAAAPRGGDFAECQSRSSFQSFKCGRRPSVRPSPSYLRSFRNLRELTPRRLFICSAPREGGRREGEPWLRGFDRGRGV